MEENWGGKEREGPGEGGGETWRRRRMMIK